MPPPSKQLSEKQWVTIKSTLPAIPLQLDSNILTQRLLIRPLAASDLNIEHILRTHPEVVAWSSTQLPNESTNVTEKQLRNSIENEETLEVAICLRETGEMIGSGGSHRREGDLGWPVLSYTLRVEAWGKGYATEFLTAFLDYYWTLPRSHAQLEVEASTAVGEDEVKQECVTSVASEPNSASQRVMEKSGMKLVKVWEVKDISTPKDDDTLIALLAYAAYQP